MIIKKEILKCTKEDKIEDINKFFYEGLGIESLCKNSK